MTSVFKCGDFIDLCTGPHINNSKQINTFKVTKNSASYWLGDQKNDSLQRIYGITFDSKAKMDEYNKMMEELAKRDHRTIVEN